LKQPVKPDLKNSNLARVDSRYQPLRRRFLSPGERPNPESVAESHFSPQQPQSSATNLILCGPRPLGDLLEDLNSLPLESCPSQPSRVFSPAVYGAASHTCLRK
ncbi:hypothetical protein BGZ99_001779, partial [Dissophora globulifera]